MILSESWCPMATKFDRDRIDRAARMYRSTKDAALALGIAPVSFTRLCRQYGIDTPQQRRRKAQDEAEGDENGTICDLKKSHKLSRLFFINLKRPTN